MTPTCWLCGSVAGELRKGTMASAQLSVLEKAVPQILSDAKHFSSSLYATGAFQAAPLVLSSEGVSLSKSMCGFFKRNCLGFQQFLPSTQSLVAFAARNFGDLSSWLGPLGWGS